MFDRLLPSLVGLVLFTQLAISQNALPIGQWRSHLPYHSGEYVTQSSQSVYYATEWSIVEVDKAERSIRLMTTTDGLSNAGIRLIRYVSGSEVLIVVYDNSVIDLVKENGEIYTINYIRNFLNIPGLKTVNDIYVANDSIVYFGASYGVSKVNVRSNRFEFSTFTGIPVEGVTVFQGDIYAATQEGIYRTAANNVFPEDFASWQLLDEGEGFPADYSASVLATFNEKLYFDINGDLYRLGDNEAALVFEPETGLSIEYLTAEGSRLLVGFKNSNGRGKAYFFNADETYGDLAAGCLGDPYYAIEDSEGRVWFGDGWRNFRMVERITDDICQYFDINSPFSQRNWDMDIANNQLWLATGGLNQALAETFSDHGVASFIDGQWNIYTRETHEELRGRNPDPVNGRADDFFDFLNVVINTVTGKVYAGSFSQGILEFDGDVITQFDKNNSSLAATSFGTTRIGGLAVDEAGNLWVANHSAANPISVLRTDGSWQSFSQDCGQESLLGLDIDLNGYKWIIISNDQAGVMVFDEGEVEDPADDRCRVFTSNNSNMPTNSTNCLVADLEGDVWVGTSQGVVIFECGGSAFDEGCIGTLRPVEGPDGNLELLLNTENVQALAIDGANRKWVGTSNGVFLLSPDGEEQIAHFTEDNSPLFDNNVLSLAVNPDNGEVFIGTNKGIISYQSDAVAGTIVNKENILVYPNPVRPEYDGPIAIQGLARDAIVKITDLNGKMVYETKALGGQAIWDGRDYNGRKAQTGVYLVFSSVNPRNGIVNNPDGAVARILFIN